jgi:release factor glutamine methyltransferase
VTATTAAGTVDEALSAAADAIAAAGCESPRLDAELLLAEALGTDRAWLAAHPGDAIEPAAGRRFGEVVRRRVRREPVAYILGRKGFRNLELQVDPRVLIPRPETELLVDVALEHEPRTVLDYGTGSGAIALAVADELPSASVRGADASQAAITVATANASRLSLDVDFDWLHPEAGYDRSERALSPGAGLLLANLPYVRDDEWDGLEPEITRWEPRDALVAGPTGFEAIELLLATVVARQLPIDAIALEVGAGQAPVVARLVARAGFAAVQTRADLAGIERVVIGRR